MMQSKSSKYMSLLINKKSKIKSKEQLEVINYLFDIFIQYNKDLLLIHDGFISPVRSRVAFETLALMEIQTKFPDIEIRSYSEEKNSYRWNVRIRDIYDTITTINTYSLLRYRSDLFAEKQTVTKNPHSSTITVTTNELHIKEPTSTPENDDKAYIDIVDDYKLHFPYLDDMLKLIIDMRFAKDRKASFLHLRVKSNWGKSFLCGLLNNIEIGIEIDYHNLMNKGANDIAPIQVRNSFVMMIDEFNNFSAEMKKLSHSFSFAPKFGMREEVELYLKILMSAEKSPSFVGGVDDQIVNRVMVMDIPDSTVGKLTDRAIYKKYGNGKYMDMLEVYAYLKISEGMFRYLDMEKFEAHRQADISVGLALSKYKMKGMKNLNVTMRGVLNDAIEEILSSSDVDLNPRYREIKGNIIAINTGQYKGDIFIKSPLKTLETILKVETSEQEYKKMKYKMSDLSSVINIVAEYSKSKLGVNGSKRSRGLVITLESKKDHNQIIQDLKRTGNLIID